MEKASDQDIFNAITVLSEYNKNNDVSQGDAELVKQRVDSWQKAMENYNRNLVSYSETKRISEFDKLNRCRPTEYERRVAARTRRLNIPKPNEVIEAEILLRRVKNQVDLALNS